MNDSLTLPRRPLESGRGLQRRHDPATD